MCELIKKFPSCQIINLTMTPQRLRSATYSVGIVTSQWNLLKLKTTALCFRLEFLMTDDRFIILVYMKRQVLSNEKDDFIRSRGS